MSRFGNQMARWGWILPLLVLFACDGGTRGSGIGTGFSTLTGSLADDSLSRALVAGGAAQEQAPIVVQVREAPGVEATVDPLTRGFTLTDVPPGDVTLDFSGDVSASLSLYGLPEAVALHLVNVRFENGVAKPAGFSITPDEGSPASVETTRRKGAAPLDVTFVAADVSVPAPAQVVWNFGDGTRSGRATTSYRYNQPGNYVVEAEITGGGQRQRAFQVIEVGEPGERTLAVTARAEPDRGLPPLSVQFTATAENNVGVVTFLWDFGDASVPGEGPSVRHLFTAEGLFLVQVTAFDEAGGESTDVVQVRVSDGTRPVPLTVRAEVDHAVGPAPHRVQLRATITGSGPVSIEWSFDDGTPPTSSPAPIHTYALPGRYFATVTVTDLTTRDTARDQAVIDVQ
jgi:PKD repeat protein